ncbi:MAG: MFS transporter [Chloroflexi bacterium]|nr:MFS transporter [Chloroflexota bacterium]
MRLPLPGDCAKRLCTRPTQTNELASFNSAEHMTIQWQMIPRDHVACNRQREGQGFGWNDRAQRLGAGRKGSRLFRNDLASDTMGGLPTSQETAHDRDERRGLMRAFVALQHRSFRLLFLSSVTSGAGSQLQLVANLWQVYAITGSALHLGFTGLARGIPIILFSLAGGVIADRVDRRKIIILTQTANGVIAALLGVLSAAGLIEVWHIYAATFLNAALMSVSAPARRAVIAGLVPRQHLMNAMALNSSVHQMDRIVAPALAGFLIALFGFPVTYAINGLAHVITAVALGFVSLGGLPARPQRTPLRDLAEGLGFIRQRSIILVLLATDAAAMLFGYYQVLLPIVADGFGMDVSGYGLLLSAPAVGSLVGTTIVMYLGDFSYKGRLIVGAILMYSACLVGLALAPWFALALVVSVGLGLTDSLQATTRNAVIQLLCPDDMRGRVSSFQHMLVSGMPALGQSLMGAAAGVLGVTAALVAGAGACAAINAGIFARRKDLRARELESAPSPVVLERPVEVAG